MHSVDITLYSIMEYKFINGMDEAVIVQNALKYD